MPRSSKAGRGAAPTRLYTLKVSLLSGPVKEAFAQKNPVVSRTIRMTGAQTLADLHDAIYDAFDREEEHMYEFQFGKKPMDRNARRYTIGEEAPFDLFEEGDEAGDVAETTLDSLGLKARNRFFYWFDFGDDWWHRIDVLSVSDEVPPGQYPAVTERVGDSPPQYPDWEDEGDEEAE
jgi:Plasmid pRiA4b ORF-3-like protein